MTRHKTAAIIIVAGIAGGLVLSAAFMTGLMIEAIKGQG